MDFSFQRPKKQKRVCIVEEDIKMTKDEIEIYNQMRDEAEQDFLEQERQAAQLFEDQKSVQPDLLGNKMTQSILKQGTKTPGSVGAVSSKGKKAMR